MSSGISIEPGGMTQESTASLPAGPTAPASLRPWHFFVMASLILATIAVVLSRQSTPEHLVLISITIGAAGTAAAGFYRMLAPLVTPDLSRLAERVTERSREAAEREKALVLRSIKELEFDRAMGKVAQRDFDEMAGRLRARAITLMKQVDSGGAGYQEIIERELAARLAGHVGQQSKVAPVAGACAQCGTSNDADAAFCKRCGSRVKVTA